MYRFGLASVFVLAVAVPASAQPADEVEPDGPVADSPADEGVQQAPPPILPLDPDRTPGLDATSVGFVSASMVAPINVVEGKGIKVGEGTALYPTVGLDTGFVSNVFYQDTDTHGAGFLRLSAGIGTGSLSAQRLAPPGGGEANPGLLQHRAELRLSYDFYLSGNDFVNEQNGLGISATVRGTVGPKRTWSFLYLDTFERIIRSTNFETTDQTNRDINHLMLGVQFQPPGRSVRGLLYYANTIDVFEEQAQRFANRIQNSVGLNAAWRFRPVTVLFATVNQGFYFGIGDATALATAKTNSYPLAITTGIQTLLSLNTSLVGRIGYTNGFYSAGPSFGTVLGGLELGYRYSPLGRATALYEYRHEDSINANFYRDHRIAMTIEQLFAPIAVSATGEVLFREYNGVDRIVPMTNPTRDDVIFGATAAARYNIRDSFAAVLQYRFATVQTDFRYMNGGDLDDPSYVRHELIAGVRAAF